MAQDPSSEISNRSDALRTELKSWERHFAAQNGGRKARREDIKSNPAIAQKYKEYNKLRDLLQKTTRPDLSSSPRSSASRKRRTDDEAPFQTPSKRAHLHTPSKANRHPANIDPYDSPSAVRSLFTPKKVLGPTPQKDGEILGLFDLLHEDTEPTPSKPPDMSTSTASATMKTPRRSRFIEGNVDGSPLGTTPASARKRKAPDEFATPLKKRDPNRQQHGTPSSVSKLAFATPSFLRRDCQRSILPAIDENGNDMNLSPEIRRPKKPISRSFSSMLANLRNMEDHAHDDDLEALREMEAEEAETATVQHGDQPRLLGGFDDEAMYDTEEETQDGQPQRAWKKKGQKRTTRRVNIKPVLQKPRSAVNHVEDETTTTVDEVTVPETQLAGLEGFADIQRPHSQTTTSTSQTKEALVGKVAALKRKATELAHTNFKRLKLRNTGAKGGPGYNSRFRRRR